MGLDVHLCAKYESFSFDPIQRDIHFGSYMSGAIESDNLVIAYFNFEQTLMPFEIGILVDLGPLFCLDRSFVMIYF